MSALEMPAPGDVLFLSAVWDVPFVGSLGRSLELQRAMSDEAKRIILSFEF